MSLNTIAAWHEFVQTRNVKGLAALIQGGDPAAQGRQSDPPGHGGHAAGEPEIHGAPAMRFPIAVSLLFAASLTALADPAPPAARAEIDVLLTRLQSSACEFNRNGTWYPATEARSHLQTKLKYLEDRNAVQTAEQFIERAASGSSMSGKPYLVRCDASAPVESKAWLTTELKALRAAGKAPAGK